jgi:hypothetical protein
MSARKNRNAIDQNSARSPCNIGASPSAPKIFQGQYFQGQEATMIKASIMQAAIMGKSREGLLAGG